MPQIRVVANRSPAGSAAGRSLRPLTHHEILTLIGPFTRRGLHADMTASRRADRRLIFNPIEHPSPLEGLPVLREVLELEVSEHRDCRLVRTLTANDPAKPRRCLSASVTAAGPDPGALLEQIHRFPRERHFQVEHGVVVTRSYRLQRDATGESGETWLPVLTIARAEVHGVNLEVDADRGGGMPAQVRLDAPPGQRLQIPQDLLAVIGRHWRPLEDYTSDWRGTIRISRREPERTSDMEAKLGRTVAHLAETLSQPPAEFHPRHLRARWRVSLRRATPLLAALGLIGATPAVSLLPMGEGTLLRMLVFHAPPLMLAGFFLFSELPRIEIPPLPRPLRQERWYADKS